MPVIFMSPLSFVQSRASAGGAPAPRRPAARTSVQSRASARPRREALDRDVLVRPRKIPALLVRGVPRPVGIVQVAAREHAEVGAPRGQDAVDVVVGGD